MRDQETIANHARTCAQEAISQGFNGDASEAEPWVADVEDLRDSLNREPSDEELDLWVATWRRALGRGPEPVRDNCETCGVEGVRSNWPGNDPRNAGAEEPILCVDADGHLVCDDCAEVSQ